MPGAWILARAYLKSQTVIPISMPLPSRSRAANRPVRLRFESRDQRGRTGIGRVVRATLSPMCQEGGKVAALMRYRAR